MKLIDNQQYNMKDKIIEYLRKNQKKLKLTELEKACGMKPTTLAPFLNSGKKYNIDPYLARIEAYLRALNYN